ncbi:MAG: hypothetical protein ACOVSW_04530 [Candidatus Kapaibacteriota bacterium]
MDYTYLIHTYLEGRLEEPLEEVLFGELSRNGSLRKELAMQINLVNAARREAASILPTEAEKMALFAELGFAEVGLAESIVVAEASVSSSSISSVQNVLLVLCSAMALTLGLRSDTFFRTNAADGALSDRKALDLPVLAMSMPQEPIKPRFSDNSAMMLSKSFSHEPLKSPSNLVSEVENSREKSEQQALPSQQDMGGTNADGNADGNTDIQASVLLSGIRTPYPLFQTKEPLSSNIKHHPQASSALLQMPESMIEQFPVQLGIRHLLGGGKLGLHGTIQYALNKQQAIGFEGGIEAARLLVRNVRSSEVSGLGAADESVFSGTAYYRHTFTGFALLPNKALVPFVQGGVGVVGRCGAVQGMGGLRFDVAPELSFVLAAEVKMPVFYAEQHFQSKTGVSIGMQYHISDK